MAAQNLPLPLGQLGGDDLAADVDVAADVAAGGDPEDGAQGLTLEEEDPLVTLGDLGDQLLDDGHAPAAVGHRLDEPAEVSAAEPDGVDAGAPMPVHRLDDRFSAFELFEETSNAPLVRDHEGFRHVLGEVVGVELLVGVAKRPGVVHDQGPVVPQMLEDQGEPQVGTVEGWVLPHEDHVGLGQRELLHGAECERALGVARRDRLSHGGDGPILLEPDVLDAAVIDAMPARLGGEHDPEGGVLVDDDRRRWVHDENDPHRSKA